MDNRSDILSAATREINDGYFERAVDRLTLALEYDPTFHAAQGPLGMALIELGRIDPAIAAFRRAVTAEPGNAVRQANLAKALATIGNYDEALPRFGAAVTLAPDNAQIRLNQAITLLKCGQLAEGWDAYEARLRLPGHDKLSGAPMLQPLRELPRGLAGRTVLVTHDEGYGDTLQFLRYVPLLAKEGATVLVWVPPELARIARTIAGAAEILAGPMTLPRFDFHCPLQSLPRIFGSTLGAIPRTTPYLAADAAAAAAWKQLLPQTGRRRIGLVWSGDPRPGNPISAVIDRQRSMSLAMLAPLAAVPDTDFISLQKGARAAEAAEPPPGLTLFDPMEDVADFADTAAIIANLDLVISVDTAVLHLAGALGKPIFLLDRYDNCWRWFTDRTDSPWYPTLRIFRQDRPGDWATVVARVVSALA